MILPTKTAISAHAMRARSGASRRGAGFTLLELMVVVVIIGVFAAMAMPGIAERMDAHQIRSGAELVANLYRSARLRAMGRGSAVLVRYSAGVFEVREGIWGPGPHSDGCDNLPSASCTEDPGARWDAGDARNQLIERFNPDGGGVFSVSMEDTSAVRAEMDICFTPSGRAYVRNANDTSPFTAMTGVPRVSLTRASGDRLVRQVLILPNGTARVTAVGP